ncbi:hypothetical protein NFX46_25610 [Streptomyces phaeoluteigriseus]|uniref:Uncharacterized protein n=1 Tax=Streptomyces phaeoluteigriseus TaxID=114686 RepID=A0ABY4ZE55_9ACTN|nr:hypothetical protein [Streptomyces phaeoluteigriseus]USQ86780.1 hypothetical protein NFX46_25610 [Streptomyces phaeoluteigriseus]
MTHGGGEADPERRRLAEADEGGARAALGPVSERAAADRTGGEPQPLGPVSERAAVADRTREPQRGRGRLVVLHPRPGPLTSVSLRGCDGRRPVHRAQPLFAKDPHWKDLLLVHEHFHGDNGAEFGVSHRTGRTGLVAATATLCHSHSHSLSTDDRRRGGRESLKSVRGRGEPLS